MTMYQFFRKVFESISLHHFYLAEITLRFFIFALHLLLAFLMPVFIVKLLFYTTFWLFFSFCFFFSGFYFFIWGKLSDDHTFFTIIRFRGLWRYFYDYLSVFTFLPHSFSLTLKEAKLFPYLFFIPLFLSF